MSTETPADGPTLIRALRQAIDDAEAELAAMPFLIRPMVRRGFASRTGKSHDEWRRALDALASRPTAAAVRALADGLERLAENFRTAPERARRGMGGDPAALRVVEERARGREAAARALLAWARTPPS